MTVRVAAATPADLDEVRDLLRRTFRGDDYQPGPLAPFYIAYDICDPEFRPEQYRFRRRRGRVVSALKVFVRRLQHPDGPVPVTLIGAVCTRADLRGRGLVGPVIRDALDYSRALGAAAQLIVTPRRNYYERHGYRTFPAVKWSGALPRRQPRGARIEPLQLGDEGWMTELFNNQRLGYGPIVRSEAYTRLWVLEQRLADRRNLGLKLLRRGRPAGYLVAQIKDDPAVVYEAVSCNRKGGDEALLLGFLRQFGRERFAAAMPDAHPLIAHLRARRAMLERAVQTNLMHYPLDASFIVPGEEFCFSALDNV